MNFIFMEHLHNKDILYNMAINSAILWCVNIIPTILNHIFCFVCAHTSLVTSWGTSIVGNSFAFN